MLSFIIKCEITESIEVFLHSLSSNSSYFSSNSSKKSNTNQRLGFLEVCISYCNYRKQRTEDFISHNGSFERRIHQDRWLDEPAWR